MNEETERVLRLIKFKMAQDYLKRILRDDSISEEEYVRGNNYLADRFGVDPATGFDLPADTPVKKEKSIDERYNTYANLTEILKGDPGSPATTIITWLRSHKTFEFLCEWERKNNPKFNEAGYRELMASGNKTITPKLWCEKTNAIGILSRQGNKGGTYVHHMIAADFMMWRDPLFRFFMISTLAEKNEAEAVEPEERVRTITEIPPRTVE